MLWRAALYHSAIASSTSPRPARKISQPAVVRTAARGVENPLLAIPAPSNITASRRRGPISSEDFLIACIVTEFD
jgi:hypothetical protein